MKIGLITNSYFPDYGGISVFVYNLGLALSRIGNNVTIYTPVCSLNNKILKPMSIVKIPNKKLHLFNFELIKEMKSKNFDVLQLSNIRNILVNLPSKVKVYTFLTLPDRKLGFLKKNIYRVMCRSFDYKVAVSSHQKRLLHAFYGLKVDHVIPTGVDAQFFRPDNDSARRDFTIGAVSLFSWPNKVAGLKVLIKAFEKVVKKHQDVKMKIVGYGKYEKELQKFARTLNIGSNVEFLGRLSYFEMPKFYNSIDLSAHISFQDSAPLTILEAMSCETPVLSNPIGFVPDVVDSSCGWIVYPNTNDIANGLLSAIESDSEILKRKGKNARQKVLKNFSWDKVAREYVKLYGTQKRQLNSGAMDV